MKRALGGTENRKNGTSIKIVLLIACLVIYTAACNGGPGDDATTLEGITYFDPGSFVDGGTDEGINYNTEKYAEHPQLVVFNDKLYAMWQEQNGHYQIRVKVYNGDDGSPSWSFVDGGTDEGINYNTEKYAEHPQLVVFNDKLYAMWQEQNGHYQIRVKAGENR